MPNASTRSPSRAALRSAPAVCCLTATSAGWRCSGSFAAAAWAARSWRSSSKPRRSAAPGSAAFRPGSRPGFLPRARLQRRRRGLPGRRHCAPDDAPCALELELHRLLLGTVGRKAALRIARARLLRLEKDSGASSPVLRIDDARLGEQREQRLDRRRELDGCAEASLVRLDIRGVEQQVCQTIHAGLEL